MSLTLLMNVKFGFILVIGRRNFCNFATIFNLSVTLYQMKHFISMSLLATAMMASVSAGLSAQTVSRAYGIQVYSESMTPDDHQKLVSFPVDNPQDVTVEEEFTDFGVMAATCYDGKYYILRTEDGMVPTKLLTYDLERRQISEVKTYGSNDLAGYLMVVDMTWDPSANRIYAVGFNLAEGQLVDDGVDAPFGLFTIDPTTGDAELVGYQETAMIVALASNEYELWGVDAEGNVWIVNKYRGWLDDIMYSTGIEAVGLQSMAYDFGSGHFYWPSYTSDGGNGKSELVWFGVNDWWEIETGEAGPVGDNIELIGFYVDDDPMNPKAPRGVEGLTVVPGAKGLGEAVLSWTNPTVTLNGTELSGDLSITIARDGEIMTDALTGTPGEEMSWTDTNVSSALYTYTVTVKADGVEGPAVYAEPVFVGTDIPGAPLDVKAARSGENYDITVTWNAPVAGAQGGWVDLSDVHYSVVRYPDNKLIVENTTALSVTDTGITALSGYSYGIKATCGDVTGPEAVSNVVVSGPAIEPPYEMTLDEADANLWTVYNEDGDDNKWVVYRDMWAGTTDPFFYFFPEDEIDPEQEKSDWIISPTFALKAGKKYVVSYDLRLYGHMFLTNSSFWIGEGATPADMTRQLAAYDRELINVEWVTHTIPFTVDKDGDYNFGFELMNLVPAHFYNFTLREVPDVDLEALGLNGPQVLAKGQPFEFKTEVKNLGFDTISTYSVLLKDAAGDTLASKTVDTPIAAGSVQSVTIEWTPEVAGRVALHAEVNVEGDADASNNLSSEISVIVTEGGAWKEVAEANYSSGREPLFVYHNYSACQSVYPADILNLEEGSEIQALNYYISDFLTKNAIDCDVEVWLANTDVDDFEFADIFMEDQMTKVYDGKVTMAPEDEQVTMVFDTPFVYTGKNLLVATRHQSDSRASVAFDCFYDKESPLYTLEYFSDDEPYDFSQMMYGARELPTMGLLVNDNSQGAVVMVAGKSGVAYDRATRVITVSREFSGCRVYSATGALVASFAPGSRMAISAGITGVCIVEVDTPQGSVVKKIAL